MAPVGNRHFIEYVLHPLRQVGIKDLILCVGYKRDQIQNWLHDGSRYGFRVRYSVEKQLLGTAGAVRLAAEMVNTDTCLVLNGDSFLELDLAGMYQFHRSQEALATIALARVQDSSRYGTVQLDHDSKIVAFHEKTQLEGENLRRHGGLSLINGGVYLIERALLDGTPVGQSFSLEKQVFPGLAGGRLYGFLASGFFIDIGVPADYVRAQAEMPRRFY